MFIRKALFTFLMLESETSPATDRELIVDWRWFEAVDEEEHGPLMSERALIN